VGRHSPLPASTVPSATPPLSTPRHVRCTADRGTGKVPGASGPPPPPPAVPAASQDASTAAAALHAPPSAIRRRGPSLPRHGWPCGPLTSSSPPSPAHPPSPALEPGPALSPPPQLRAHQGPRAALHRLRLPQGVRRHQLRQARYHSPASPLRTDALPPLASRCLPPFAARAAPLKKRGSFGARPGG
jgi:hypothetical protein